MDKTTLAILLIPVAIINFYWAARSHSLMKFKGSPEEMELKRKEAEKLAHLSKTYTVLGLLIYGIFLIFKEK